MLARTVSIPDNIRSTADFMIHPPTQRMTRSHSNTLTFAAMLLIGVCTCVTGAAAGSRQSEPPPRTIPVILDTDIGNDIDDTWALAMLLRTPGLDLRLVTTTDGQAEYRARLVAKLLTIAGRSDVPIALGAGKPSGQEREKTWLDDFKLADYRGTVHRDGVRALIDTINSAKEPPTIIAIGPLQTLAAALAKDPSIAAKTNLVGMQGSVFKGYGGSPTPAPEFNIKVDVAAAQKVLSAPWRSIAITPLDTCGLAGVSISAEQYETLRGSADPLVGAILDSYAAWSGKDAATLKASTTLFDTVAIYLARPSEPSLLVTRELKIAVSDAGMTSVSESGRAMTVATDWTDLRVYRNYLMKTLLAPP